MGSRPRAKRAPEAPEAAELPTGMPYTLYFPRRGGGFAPADIEYAAPLPRLGDLVEYIDPQGVRHWYTVSSVVHTFQDRQAAEMDGIGLLRAGLPAVYLARSRRKVPRQTS
jgi:hypothetical protein